MVEPSSDASMPAAEEVAAALREARFVRVVASADGAALAASGILARALRERDIPFQVRVRRATASAADDVLTVYVGAVDAPGADGATAPDLRLAELASAPVRAFEAATALGEQPDPTLALAGVAAERGLEESSSLLERAGDTLRRRPGVATPVADLGDGLAHATWFHAPFSGEVEAARATLADLGLRATPDDDDHRRLASLVALEATARPDASQRSAEAVGRALRPHTTSAGPFATVEGYADVLSAVAREEPGVGVGLALGHDVRSRALDAWRTHADAVHGTLHAATLARYSGLVVARFDDDAAAPRDTGDEDDESRQRRRRLRLRSAARLLRDFRSPEPVVLVVDRGVAAAASLGPDVREALVTAAERVGGDATGTSREGDASYGAGGTTTPAGLDDDYVNAVREALS